MGSSVPDYDAISLACNGSTRDSLASVFVGVLLMEKAVTSFAAIDCCNDDSATVATASHFALKTA